MRTFCTDCVGFYDDAERSTICPHNRLPPQGETISTGKEAMRTFELTDDEGDLLTLALGMATGIAAGDKNLNLVRSLLRLANAVHRNNPDWTPYEIPKQGELSL